MSATRTRTSLAALAATLIIALLLLGGTSFAQAPVSPGPSRDVRVVNGVDEPVPVQQQGASRVTVENLPATQAVSGTVGVISSAADPIIVQQVGGSGAPAVHEPFQETIRASNDTGPTCVSLFPTANTVDRDIVVEMVTIGTLAGVQAHPQVDLQLLTFHSAGAFSTFLPVALSPAGTSSAGGHRYGGQLDGPFQLEGGVNNLRLCVGGAQVAATALVTGYYTS